MDAPTNHRFLGEEEHLRAMADTHLESARRLVSDGQRLLTNAFFLVRMAAECLLKHLYCMLRLAQGSRADRAATVKPARSWGHDAKRLGGVLIREQEVRRSRALEAVVRLFPSGTAWNEARYAPPSKDETVEAFDEFEGWVLKLMEDIDTGVEDV
ncbi:MAG TPA: hypothetical protein VI356_23035 [Myxococcales bacterium]